LRPAGTRAQLAGPACENPRAGPRTVAAVSSKGSRRLYNIADAHRTIEKAQRGWNRWRVTAIAAVALAMLAIGAALWLRNATHLPGRSQWVPLTKLPDSVTKTPNG
jgi:anti-sigma-K factor RskA